MTTATEAVANALEQLRNAKRDFEDESTRVQKSVHDLSQDVKQLREALAVQNDAQAKSLLEAVQALHEELAQTKAALHVLEEAASRAQKTANEAQQAGDQAQRTADKAQQTAGQAATKAELSSYLPVSGGTITGSLHVTGHLRAPELTVGNIYGHGNQQIHLPAGSNADHIFMNWHRGGSVFTKGEFHSGA